ncbi:hypothetical protein KN1_02070 [Stygiolobus caldivivus]|uniref:Uncharacterized protein n=1 Tax=Stygiolobus caldivivus TaxID=2824673 RepID=A0A8D5ZHV1_9CREN|nr:hypothetical protein KN1_02070 [Stygiolobus caldivivus]
MVDKTCHSGIFPIPYSSGCIGVAMKGLHKRTDWGVVA